MRQGMTQPITDARTRRPQNGRLKRRSWSVLPPALALAAALAVSGCEVPLPGQGEPPQLYTLNPKSTYEDSLPTADMQLVIEKPIAAAGLETTRIAVRRTPITLDYFARSAWIDTAPALVQTLLIESFENSRKIKSVGRESIGLRADYILKIELREFQAKIIDGEAPRAEVRLNVKLVKMPERVIVGSFTVGRAVESEGETLPQVISAFDEALGKVLKRTVTWTLESLGGATNLPAEDLQDGTG